MAFLNSLSCLQITANTGIGACPIDPKNITGVILAPKGFTLDATSASTLQTALEAAALSVTKSTRILPIYSLGEPKDSSEDVTIQSFNTGQKAVVREGYQDWTFQIIESGGIDLLKKLRTLNVVNTAYDFFFVDSQNLLIGTIDPNSATNIKAIPSDGGYFYAHPWKMNDGSKVAAYMIQFVFKPIYINEQLAYAQTNFSLQDNVKGLQDVTLNSPSTNATSGSYNLTATVVNGQINMHDAYGTILAAPGLWTAINTATGLAITILTVTSNAVFNGWVIALDKTSPNYPTSGTVTFSLGAPATLSASSVLNYESNIVRITFN